MVHILYCTNLSFKFLLMLHGTTILLIKTFHDYASFTDCTKLLPFIFMLLKTFFSEEKYLTKSTIFKALFIHLIMVYAQVINYFTLETRFKTTHFTLIFSDQLIFTFYFYMFFHKYLDLCFHSIFTSFF